VKVVQQLGAGHRGNYFGTNLPDDAKRALIESLKTL